MSTQEISDTLEAYRASTDEDKEYVAAAQESRKRALEAETGETANEVLLEAAGAAGAHQWDVKCVDTWFTN